TVFYAPLGFAGKQFGTECGFRRMVFLHRIPCSPVDRETGPDGVRSASFVFVPNRAGRTAASCGFAGRLPFVPALHGGVQCAAEAIAPPLPLPEEGIKTLPAADRPGHLTLLAFAGGGGSGRSALADSYSIGRMRTSATPFKARSRRSRSVFSSTSP